MRARVRSDTAFLDMVFNLVLAFSFLFLMSFLLIRPPTEPSKPAVEMKAEFVIVLAWPDGSLDDQDIWIRMPDGRMVGYSHRDIGIATLDRDDRGGIGNFFIDPIDGELKLQRIRREMITIRAIIPGRYVVNVHTFSARNEYGEFVTDAPLPYDVEVSMMKLNPRYQDIIKRKLLMEKMNDQKTAFAFTVDATGHIVEIEADIDEPFVPSFSIYHGQ